MPILTGQIEPDGALVDVLIGWSRSQVQRLRAAGRPIPSPVSLRALLDPGAECTCVDPQAVAILALPVIGISLANLPATTGLAPAVQRDASLTIVHPSGAASQNLVLHGWSIT